MRFSFLAWRNRDKCKKITVLLSENVVDQVDVVENDNVVGHSSGAYDVFLE
jgi:predicted transcriptional regulator